MTDDTLLPCPFCGSHDISLRTRKTTIVECKGCGVLIIKSAHIPSIEQHAAIEAWNRRAKPEQT